MASNRIFLFHATIPSRQRSAVSAIAKADVTPSSLSRNLSELVEAICQVVFSDLRDELQGELKLICEDMNELRISATKVVDHISVCMDSIEKTLSFTVLADEVAQLLNDINVFLEGRMGLSHEMDIWLSRVAELFAPLKQKDSTSTAPASVLKERRKQSKKTGYTSDTDAVLSKDSLTTGFEEEPWFSR